MPQAGRFAHFVLFHHASSLQFIAAIKALDAVVYLGEIADAYCLHAGRTLQASSRHHQQA